MRILFVTSTRVGDAMLSTGVLAELLRRNPNARVTVACGPAAASLFEAVPGLERIIVLTKMRGSLHWLKLWAQTVTIYWDVLVDLRNAPITYLIGKKTFYRLTNTRDTGHRVPMMGRVIGMADDPPPPFVWIDAARHQRAAQLIPDGGPVLAIGPTANWRGKQWRAEYFAKVVKNLTDKDGVLPGARVAIVGHGDERDMVLPLISSIPTDRVIDLVGGVDVLTAAACLNRTDLYIGNDSGLMHIAAACGVPTLGLFGPSQVEKYAPWGEHCAYVQASVAYDDIFPEDFDHRETDTLMDSLSVEDVTTAAVALWKRTRDCAA